MTHSSIHTPLRPSKGEAKTAKPFVPALGLWNGTSIFSQPAKAGLLPSANPEPSEQRHPLFQPESCRVNRRRAAAWAPRLLQGSCTPGHRSEERRVVHE